MRSDTVALECEQGTGAPIQVAEVHCNTPIHGALAESIAIRTDEFFTLYCNTATWTAHSKRYCKIELDCPIIFYLQDKLKYYWACRLA